MSLYEKVPASVNFVERESYIVSLADKICSSYETILGTPCYSVQKIMLFAFHNKKQLQLEQGVFLTVAIFTGKDKLFDPLYSSSTCANFAA